MNETKKTRHFEASQVLAVFLVKFNEPNGEDNRANVKTGINHNIAIDYYLKICLMDVVVCVCVCACGPYQMKSNQTNGEYVNLKFCDVVQISSILIVINNQTKGKRNEIYRTDEGRALIKYA